MGDITYAECHKSHSNLGGKTDGCQEFVGTWTTCDVCGCHLNFHRKVRPLLIYTKCHKIHEFKFQNSVDGCQQFVPAGRPDKPTVLICAICGCHKGFHQWEFMEEKEAEELKKYGETVFQVNCMPLHTLLEAKESEEAFGKLCVSNSEKTITIN